MFLIIVLIILIIWLLYNDNTIVAKHCSSIDDRCYPIVTTFDSSTFNTASDLLAYLNRFNITMIKHMRNKYLWNDSSDLYRVKMAKKLLKNYNPDAIIENNPKTTVNTSYVSDKGRVFAVCLREKQSGLHKFHDKHVLEFVVLHELSHLTNDIVDHSDEFWKDFKILLSEAKELGLHIPIDYKQKPMNYCSVHVDYSPYYDDNISDVSRNSSKQSEKSGFVNNSKQYSYVEDKNTMPYLKNKQYHSFDINSFDNGKRIPDLY